MDFWTQLPQQLLIFLAFIFGTAIGSFLNVLIWRLPREETIQGRSYCPHCSHQLVWHDLVPVFSYLFQRGECKYCSKPVSFRYPLIELITGILFGLAMWLYPVVDLLTFLLFLKIIVAIAICVVVFVIDLEHYLILDKLVYPGIILMLFFSIVLDLFGGGTFSAAAFLYAATIQGLIGAAVAFIPFWLLWFGSRGKWMGYGDVKFVAFMGLALGWRGVIMALLVSFVVGAMVGLILIAAGKKQLSSKIPFGTFLSLSTILALFWGMRLWDLYWNLILIS